MYYWCSPSSSAPYMVVDPDAVLAAVVKDQTVSHDPQALLVSFMKEHRPGNRDPETSQHMKRALDKSAAPPADFDDGDSPNDGVGRGRPGLGHVGGTGDGERGGGALTQRTRWTCPVNPILQTPLTPSPRTPNLEL